MIAHRGASAHAPEHTLAAYDLALAQGADMLELDVRSTAEGELLVVHDPTLLRTSGVPHAVAALRSAEVDALPPARRPLRLEAVLDRYGERVQLLVELKDPAPAWERRVVHEIARRGLASRAAIQSFDLSCMRRLASEVPGIPCLALLHRAPGPATLEAIAGFAAGVAVDHGCVDAELVARTHDRGMRVLAWTVNEPAEIARVVALAVDGVITDAPDEVVALAGPRPALAAVA